MRNFVTLILAAILSLNCGDSAPFNPESIDLAGTWVLTENYSAVRGDGVPGQCVRTTPLEITRGVPDLSEWVAQTQEGTVVQCTFEGQTGPPTLQESFDTYRVQKVGASVTISFFNGFDQFHGELTSSSSMEGDLEPELRSVSGTWEAHRQ